MAHRTFEPWLKGFGVSKYDCNARFFGTTHTLPSMKINWKLNVFDARSMEMPSDLCVCGCYVLNLLKLDIWHSHDRSKIWVRHLIVDNRAELATHSTVYRMRAIYSLSSVSKCIFKICKSFFQTSINLSKLGVDTEMKRKKNSKAQTYFLVDTLSRFISKVFSLFCTRTTNAFMPNRFRRLCRCWKRRQMPKGLTNCELELYFWSMERSDKPLEAPTTTTTEKHKEKKKNRTYLL